MKSAVALLALAVPGAAAAQLDALASDERQRLILDEIVAIQAQRGAYAPELLERLGALIVLYRESDDASLALVAIERALQVMRANYGLHSLDQLPLLWQRIEAEEARGNDAEVWDLEQELLALVRRHPDDLRAAEALRQMADRQMAVLDRVLAGERPPQVALGCFYKPWPYDDGGSCEAGSRKDVVQGMLAEAQRNYADAIAVLLRNEAYSSDELRDLEMELLRGAELVRATYEHERRGITGSRIRTRVELPVPLAPVGAYAEIREPWRSRTAPLRALLEWELPADTASSSAGDFLYEYETRARRLTDPYHRGRQSLRRLYTYDLVDGGSPVREAAALVRLADWDLLFSYNGFAVEGYELALALLDGEGSAPVAQLFAPATPVVLPAFEPNPLARDTTRLERGHIDVAFAITKYGRGRDIEIRAAANATGADRHALVALLKSSRFRPRLADGELAALSPVEVRYYLYD